MVAKIKPMLSEGVARVPNKNFAPSAVNPKRELKPLPIESKTVLPKFVLRITKPKTTCRNTPDKTVLHWMFFLFSLLRYATPRIVKSPRRDTNLSISIPNIFFKFYSNLILTESVYGNEKASLKIDFK